MPCNEPPFLQPTIDFLQPAIDHLVDKVVERAVAAERERCAKIAEAGAAIATVGPDSGVCIMAACAEIAARIRGGQ